MTFRPILCTLAALPLLLSWDLHAATHQLTVFKTRTCGCCNKWVEHARANGFEVTVKDVASTAEYRKKYGVPDAVQSCHTAIAEGYTMEGHVPAAEMLRLLKTRPKAKGLAVPGMPLGSPGMEASRRQPYSVLLFDATGRISEYQKYPGD